MRKVFKGYTIGSEKILIESVIHFLVHFPRFSIVTTSEIPFKPHSPVRLNLQLNCWATRYGNTFHWATIKFFVGRLLSLLPFYLARIYFFLCYGSFGNKFGQMSHYNHILILNWHTFRLDFRTLFMLHQ